MKVKLNIKSIFFMAIISIASMLFINISFAANTGKVSTETARLRQEPQTESNVLELISSETEIEILEEQGEWYKVKHNDLIGYIRSDLITIENKEDEATEVATEANTSEATEEVIAESVSEENTGSENIENKEVIKGEIYKLSKDVKLKIIPLINSMEIESLSRESAVKATEILGDWIKIQTSNNGIDTQGWIRKENIQIEETVVEEEATEEETEEVEENPKEETSEETEIKKTMYVNTQTVNLRENADTSAKILKQLTINTEVTVLAVSNNGWASVEIDGQKGYISASLLSSTKQETSRSGSTERDTITKGTTTNSTTTATSNGEAVVAYAKQFLGSSYVNGGNGPSAFDCSGFTKYVYSNFNVNLNRTAAAQYSNGTSVSDLQAGDLVMFGPDGISHVGIYIGGGTFIHAANPSRGVTTDTLLSGYYKTNYVGARRVY